MNDRILLKLYRMKKGLLNTIEKPYKYPYIFIHFGFVYYILYKVYNVDFGKHYIKIFMKNTTVITIVLLSIIIFLKILIRSGIPFGSKTIHKNMYKIGLKNSIGETPILISKEKLKKDSIYSYIFMNNGISLEDFESKRSRIESALNIKIYEIKQVDGQNKTSIIASLRNSTMVEVIDWKEEYIMDGDFELVLGETITEQLKIDIARVPHILIGGSTGSGKSVLLKLIIKQCIKKKADIILADFKGGIDFPKIWHEKCNLITTLEDFTIVLENTLYILEDRKNKLIETECSNIKDYNINIGKMNRIIIACDEIAQILDKKGVTKEHKEKILIVESYLTTISQLGRAFGIHLILSTQRPDATIISGQIKSNIGHRICGRADSVLSSIILDNSTASTLIPKDSQGLFLTQNMEIFQGYWFDDNII